MPSKPTLTCSMCGKPCWKGPSSRPSPVCRDCQRSLPKKPRVRSSGVCAQCGEFFASDARNAKHCSISCGNRSRKGRRPLAPKKKPTTEQNRRHYEKRRAAKAGVDARDVDRQAIFERDKWRCQLCGKRVDGSLVFPHPQSKSLDHIIPISLGGPHSPENVQLAHLSCNRRKSNRGSGEQLMLIG